MRGIYERDGLEIQLSNPSVHGDLVLDYLLHEFMLWSTLNVAGHLSLFHWCCVGAFFIFK